MFQAPAEFRESLNSASAEFAIWPENAATVQLFLQLQTQWMVTPGGFIGLSYPAVQAVFEIQAVQNRAEIFADLQAMEAAALPVLNKRVKANGSKGSH